MSNRTICVTSKEDENKLWQEKKEQEYQAYLQKLSQWNVVSINSIQPIEHQVLYIIGNGFDLMHRVPSSYFGFRDSLGQKSSLRFALETFWNPDDIWADFENALAKFRAKAMSSLSVVDNWLDIYGVYNKDSGAAEFSMATEAAANPMLTVVNELPRRFRMWVESLAIGTDDRPLRSMFKNGKVLCFNYTEFVETMYGIPEECVCYIHGCRRKKKNHPKEELIIGHQPGASEDSFEYEEKVPGWLKQPYKRYLAESARDQVVEILSDCDERLTKHSLKIIDHHQSFFQSLEQTQDIVVIGHSLSPVDWDYFDAVCSGLKDKNDVHWYFGCHGLRDLDNLEQLLTKLDVIPSQVSVFRTDTISVTPLKIQESVSAKKVKRYQEFSNDRRWIVRFTGSFLEIIDNCAHNKSYEVSFSSVISSAFFTSTGEHLMVIIRGLKSGVMLLNHGSVGWQFVRELEGIPNQGILNSRLCRVILKEQDITFVYNNRVRVYDLKDGRLVKNQAMRNARDGSYDGEDISSYFIRKTAVKKGIYDG